MGYGLPAAIAAALAYPDRQVVCFAGDGDLQMGLAELGTAVQHGARMVILVLNNGAYGTIRMHQERKYPSRVSGTNLHNPDFAAVAQAFGMKGFRVRKTEDFAEAFEKASESETGALLELIVSVEAITPRKTIADLRSGG
jgi:acetolactate synthase-1/2/3 large subunit